jgi:murein DD-endopeptidase MepM/ murein hydrolase activator NlpD
VRRLAALAAAMVWLSACAARQAPQRPALARSGPARKLPVPLAASEFHEEPQVVGVVHVVRKGETVYRIARAYGVAPADLLEENGIADPRQVAVGTELFVPGASRVVDLAEVTGGAPPAGQRTGAHAPPPAGEPERGDTANRGRLAWPLKGVLYGRYGVRAGRRHDGIDLSAPEGTRIAAAGPGTVIYAGEQSGYGSIVILRHDGGLVTLYAHCSALLVEEGASVKAGQVIARVGQTGRSTGPHLHFEVREGTRPRNPLLFLP